MPTLCRLTLGQLQAVFWAGGSFLVVAIDGTVASVLGTHPMFRDGDLLSTAQTGKEVVRTPPINADFS
ncbi:MAG: hypothetical protein ACJAWY_000822 [Sphingomonas echinoides]|jgi:hypothetical protein